MSPPQATLADSGLRSCCVEDAARGYRWRASQAFLPWVEAGLGFLMWLLLDARAH